MKFHILVLWIIDLTEIICIFYILIYTYFINLCYSESLRNCVLKSEKKKNRVSWFYFIFLRCSAFLVCIWLNNSEQFCFGCNQDNIKLLRSRWTGNWRNRLWQTPGRDQCFILSCLVCSLILIFITLGFSFLLLFLQPLCGSNITASLKIAFWTERRGQNTTVGWWFGYKNLWARGLVCD